MDDWASLSFSLSLSSAFSNKHEKEKENEKEKEKEDISDVNGYENTAKMPLTQTSSASTSVSKESVLCVDLDGTLIRTDLLWESICALLAKRPWEFPLIPIWLLRGRAHLKRQLANRVTLNPQTLPYHTKLIEYLKIQHQHGRKLVLATASDVTLAKPVADYVGIFDEVLGSDGITNLRSANKATLLSRRFGSKQFTYAGNSSADVKVWRAAGAAILVDDGLAFAKQLGETKIESTFLVRPKSNSILRALRPHQWLKNILIFVPIAMAHALSDPSKIVGTLLGFIAFSLCASAVYIVNDLCDLEADRKHHRKCLRPFANGDLLISTGFIIVPLLFLASTLLSLSISIRFLEILGLYVIATTGYSMRLKQIAMLDIVTLAALYTLRIIAGGAAASVPVSPWLLAFSMFFFFSLACIKRYSELYLLKQAQKTTAVGRGYRASDLDQISQIGTACGYISVLVLALYTSSREVTVLYRQPGMLWLICPMLMYWISRVWLITSRGEIHEDPVLFAIRDLTSYIVGLLAVAVILFAI